MALILVVDDIEETCESLKASLTADGHTVHTVQRISAGIDQLRKCRTEGWAREPYAVAIIDLMFQKGYDGTDYQKAGIHVLKEALKVPFLQPIILTAYPSIASITEAHEMGAFCYLTKAEHDDQYFMRQLSSTVKKALEKRDSTLALSRSLELMKGALDSIRKNGIEGHNLEDAQRSLREAEVAYESLLESLGPLIRVTFLEKTASRKPPR